MKFYVGVTDDTWLAYLAALQPDEINFWRPGGGRSFRAIEPGAPFLFKLRSPRNVIVGGGFFLRHSLLPLSLAWEAFEQRNGAPSRAELARLVNSHRANPEDDPMIGCTILTAPFFIPEGNWVSVPADWQPNIVQGKTYDTDERNGADLWKNVLARLLLTNAASAAATLVREESARYGTPFLTTARLGQGAFRILVTEAYSRRCAITGERTLPVLEAAHIKPFAENGPSELPNGLLLRSDLHILFDKGYLTITPDHRVNVSKSIRERFANGREYYRMHGNPLASLPANPAEQPCPVYLEWHNENRFLR